MVVSRCLCFGKALRPSGSRSCAIALFITSWYVVKPTLFFFSRLIMLIDNSWFELLTDSFQSFMHFWCFSHSRFKVDLFPHVNFRIFFIIAVSCLLAASVRNAYHTKYRNALSCKVVRKGIFAAGAAFVVLTGIVSELYYVSYSKANDGEATYARDTGVRMGNL